MSVYALERFKTFCREMYYQNQEEREQYRQEQVTFEKYVEENKRFLLETFSKKEE